MEPRLKVLKFSSLSANALSQRDEFYNLTCFAFYWVSFSKRIIRKAHLHYYYYYYFATASQKTSHFWLAITLTHMNGFGYFLAEMLPIK